MTYQEKVMLDSICEPYEQHPDTFKETEQTEVQTRIKKAVVNIWGEFLQERGDDINDFCNVVDLMTEYFLATEDDETPTPFWAMSAEEFVSAKGFIINTLRNFAKLGFLYENDFEREAQARKTTAQQDADRLTLTEIIKSNAETIKLLEQEKEMLKNRLAKAEKNDK